MIRLLMLTVFFALLTGCASTQNAPPEATAAAAEVPVETAVAEVPEDFDGDGLNLPLDGSSVEAFEASMALVKQHTDEASFTSLEAAVGYLRLYDLEARGSKEIVAKKLDGKTGYEVLDMVRWRKTKPGMSPAEKGSRDASLIDT